MADPKSNVLTASLVGLAVGGVGVLTFRHRVRTLPGRTAVALGPAIVPAITAFFTDRTPSPSDPNLPITEEAHQKRTTNPIEYQTFNRDQPGETKSQLPTNRTRGHPAQQFQHEKREEQGYDPKKQRVSRKEKVEGSGGDS